MLYRDTSYGGLYNFQVKGSLIQRQRSGADPGGGVDWMASHPPLEKPKSPKSPNLGPNVG